MKKIIAILITLAALLAAIAGCTPTDIIDPNESRPPANGILGDGAAGYGVMTLAYNHSDSLNPYTAVTRHNRRLATLMFDSLVMLDENIEPIYSLAEDITINGRECTIRIRSAVFSDGTPVTAEDVRDSINSARNSEGRFAEQAANIESVRAANSTTVVIRLREEDPHFINMLDFPIYKRGTANRRDEDSRELPPIGSGRYVYQIVDGQPRLMANYRWRGNEPGVAEILLISTPDDEALNHNLSMGAISIYYTDAIDGAVPRMPGSIRRVSLNNIVFLGVNSARVDNHHMRRAISFAIDRAAISQNDFNLNAQPATGLFNPSWGRHRNFQILNERAAAELAIAQLAEAGYTQRNSDGYFIEDSGRLSLSLLVNEENAMRVAAAESISVQLRRAGIEIELISLPMAEYLSRLRGGNFDLYIAEVGIPKNMDMSAVIIPGGAAAYGISANSPTAAAYLEYRAGDIDSEEFMSVFEEDLPIIPIGYRLGILSYSNRISGSPTATLSDIFFNIDSYTFN